MGQNPWGTAEQAVLMSPLHWEVLSDHVRPLIRHVHLYRATHIRPECIINVFGDLCG
jgi:hypothetical protein